ncbi:MAG: hypothetical protein H0U27_01035 [Nitrosopumilus sp.]|nr:hypothetical protein [Nitrosopumilus sp.]
MKNKLLIGFIITLHAASISAMDGCDHVGLESAVQRYTLCIKNSKEIDPKSIDRDLQFLSPEALKSTDFAKYAEVNSFELIARYAFTKHQQQAVKIFAEEFESVKTDDLLRGQLCMLLDKIIINLRPSINIDISANPVLKSFMENPSFKFPKMLSPSLVDETK